MRSTSSCTQLKRNLLSLHYLRGMTLHTVADVLEIPLGTASRFYWESQC
jgi:hypothetical protein